MNFYLPENITSGDTMLTIKSPKTLDELSSRMGSYLGQAILLKYGKGFTGSGIDAEGNILAKPVPTDLKGVTFGVAALSGGEPAKR